MTAREYAVQVDSIDFGRDEAAGTDGAVWYLILTPCTDQPCRHVCEAHPRTVHMYERQAFRRGSFGHRLNASAEEIADDRANVWGWDGANPPTLTPSFLAEKGRPYRMHSFLRAGAIDLCGDSTVRLAAHPVPCDL